MLSPPRGGSVLSLGSWGLCSQAQATLLQRLPEAQANIPRTQSSQPSARGKEERETWGLVPWATDCPDRGYLGQCVSDIKKKPVEGPQGPGSQSTPANCSGETRGKWEPGPEAAFPRNSPTPAAP